MRDARRTLPVHGPEEFTPGAPEALRRLVAACRGRGRLPLPTPRRAHERRLAAARALLAALGDGEPRSLRRMFVDGVPGRLVIGDRYLVLVPGVTPLRRREPPRVLTREAIRHVGLPWGSRRLVVWLDDPCTLEVPVRTRREGSDLRRLIAPAARHRV